MDNELITTKFLEKEFVKKIYNPDELSDQFTKTREFEKTEVKNYNGFILEIIHKIIKEVNNNTVISKSSETDEILQIKFYNRNLQDITTKVLRDKIFTDIISHIDFTVKYYNSFNTSLEPRTISRKNEKNRETIDGIIANIFNNCLFIEYNNEFNFTITYVINTITKIGNELRPKRGYLQILPIISNNVSDTKIHTNFTIQNYSKLVFIDKDINAESQLSLFIKDNIERVYTNYKKYDITDQSLVPQNMISDNIKAKLLEEIKIIKPDIFTETDAIKEIKTYSTEDAYKYIEKLYDLPEYKKDDEKSKLFYLMFTYLFAQKYSLAIEAIFYNLVQPYISLTIKDDKFIVVGDIIHQEIYDPVNSLLIFKVFKYGFSGENIMSTTVNKLILCEITTIYDLNTDNLYVDLIMHRDHENDLYKFSKPVVTLDWLFSKPKIFFIDTHQERTLGHTTSHISHNLRKRSRNITLRKRKSNNLTT